MQYLHTMVRVTDVDKSLAFYCNLLGLKEVSRTVNEKGRFTLIFLAAPADEERARSSQWAPMIELTYNWDTHAYDIGNGFGHIALGVPDVYKTCAELRAKGVKIVREPGPMKHGSSSNAIAFLEDPNGYKIELTTRAE